MRLPELENTKMSNLNPPSTQQRRKATIYSNEMVASEFNNLTKAEKKEKERTGTLKNLTRKESKALKALQTNEDIVIRPADKGGGVVIQNYDDYHHKSTNILSDKEFYKKNFDDHFPMLDKLLSDAKD